MRGRPRVDTPGSARSLIHSIMVQISGHGSGKCRSICLRISFAASPGGIVLLWIAQYFSVSSALSISALSGISPRQFIYQLRANTIFSHCSDLHPPARTFSFQRCAYSANLARSSHLSAITEHLAIHARNDFRGVLLGQVGTALDHAQGFMAQDLGKF